MIILNYENKIEILGSMGGGLKLEIKGNGFSEKTEVTICDKACKLIANSFTSMTCIVSLFDKELITLK